NRHADNDLVDSLSLARVASDSYSLVDMQSGAVSNNLAFVEYDFGLINASYGSKLVVQEALAALPKVFREPDPIADRTRDFLALVHAELPRLVERQLFLDAILFDDNRSTLTTKDFPLFAALKPLFFGSLPNCSSRNLVKLHDQPWLMSDGITLLRVGEVEAF